MTSLSTHTKRSCVCVWDCVRLRSSGPSGSSHDMLARRSDDDVRASTIAHCRWTNGRWWQWRPNEHAPTPTHTHTSHRILGPQYINEAPDDVSCRLFARTCVAQYLLAWLNMAWHGNGWNGNVLLRLCGIKWHTQTHNKICKMHFNEPTDSARCALDTYCVCVCSNVLICAIHIYSMYATSAACVWTSHTIHGNYPDKGIQSANCGRRTRRTLTVPGRTALATTRIGQSGQQNQASGAKLIFVK